MAFIRLTLAYTLEFFKAQIKLFALSFLILAIGLFILDQPWFLMLALGIALIDCIPLIGSGLVFIPWMIYEFIWQDRSLAIGLLILFIVLEVSQYILEPILVGKDLDLPLWLTFLASFISLFMVTNVFTVFLIPLVLPAIAALRTCLSNRTMKPRV